MQQRSTASKKKIKKHWEKYFIDNGKFDSVEEYWEDDYCFSCGFYGPTERAHIIAHQKNGSGKVENLHLLCQSCHKRSEHFSGDEYFRWLDNANIITSIIPLSLYQHLFPNDGITSAQALIEKLVKDHSGVSPPH